MRISDTFVEWLEGKVKMGIDAMHIVNTRRGLGIVQVSASSETILARKFVPIAHLT